jgi:hypothetical protein
MRKLAFVFAVVFVFPTSGFSQSIQIGPGGVRVDDGRGRGQCEELRRACENKDRLASKARETAADIGKLAKGQSGGMCAENCALLA